PIYKKLQTNFSSVDKVVTVYPSFNGKAIADGKEIYLNGAFTESSFLQVFGFSLAAGDPSTALQKPNTIVISKNTADKFFGKQNPIGKLFTMEGGENFIVTGVMNPLPGKSHLNYDVYASYSSVRGMEKNKKLPLRADDWFAFNASYTYVLLKTGFTAATLDNELKTVSAELNRINHDGVSGFKTQSLAKITPGDESLYNDNSRSSWTKFYFEIGIAFIILLAACFNYTNLTTARALTRAKEVGIRKVTGAKRSQIFVQYVIESVLLAFLALGFAWVLLAFIIQYAPFNDGYEFVPSSFHYNTSIAAWSVAFALFTGLLAGTAPAWILSSFQPVRVLKNLSTARIFGKVSIQKALIVFQYSLSLVIIIFLFAFYQQFAHLAAADPGFKKENVLVLPLNGIDEKIAAQQVASVSGVKSVSAMSASFGSHFNGMNMPVWTAAKNDAISINYLYANAAFIKDMQLGLLAGNNFTSDEPAKEKYILLNEQAAFGLGFKDFSKAIGQPIWINDSVKLEIAGIIKNFNYENAGMPVRALAIRNKKDATAYLYITANGRDKPAQQARILQSLKEIAPKQVFTLSWLDEDWENSNSQTATISLLGYIAFMVVAIATLGLTGLVIYTVEVKRKEISVRKILGAEKKQIVRILSTGFIKLLFIAGCIAVPLGYTAGYLFLQNFANRSGFGVVTALLCFVFLLIIGLLTIISQTWRAASANPVKDMRME
ncbi:MAG TPA: FtsX-like permease family protein, partial [Chitinophagaceae bacterium]|nr:FtsX-like permease family protein [Chitinophagaceae bacterium]